MGYCLINVNYQKSPSKAGFTQAFDFLVKYGIIQGLLKF